MGNFKPDVEALLRAHNVALPTIQEHAKKLPPFMSANLNVVAQDYLYRVLKVTTDKQPMANDVIIKVKDLQRDIWSSVEVYVASKLHSIVYVGCPKCQKGIKGGKDGEVVDCPTCKESVEITTYYWPRYIAGDDSGELILRLNPTTSDAEDLTSKVVTLRGRIQDSKGNVDFQIYTVLEKKDVDITVTPPPSALPKVELKPPPTKPTPSAIPTSDPSKVVNVTSDDAFVEKVRGHMNAFGHAPNHVKVIEFLENYRQKNGVAITVEAALDKLGYVIAADRTKIVKKEA